MILTFHTAAQIQDQNNHAALEPEATLRHKFGSCGLRSARWAETPMRARLWQSCREGVPLGAAQPQSTRAATVNWRAVTRFRNELRVTL